jgi:hypothetical protein
MTSKKNFLKKIDSSVKHSERVNSNLDRSALQCQNTVTPRLLNRKQAASYCGVSTPTFSATCPVAPVTLGDGIRLERFDIRLLDKWIDTLGGNHTSLRKNWLTAWDETHGNRSR